MKWFYFMAKNTGNKLDYHDLTVKIATNMEEINAIRAEVDSKEYILLSRTDGAGCPETILKHIIVIGISKMIAYIESGLGFIYYNPLYDLDDDETFDDVDPDERFYGIECTVCPCYPSFFKNYNFDIDESFFKIVERLANECGYSFRHRRNNQGANKVQFLITSRVED